MVLIGAVVQLAGIYSYIRETLRGNTKPNKVTWLMWTVAPMIATFAAISNGVGWPALPVFMSGFGPLLVLLASFANNKAYWKLEKWDYACGFFSFLALMLWGITRQPDIAIIFAILSDGFAAAPTLVKIWSRPETETIHAYTTGAFNALTSFAAISVWSFSAYAFPAYLVFINGSLILAFYLSRYLKDKRTGATKRTRGRAPR